MWGPREGKVGKEMWKEAEREEEQGEDVREEEGEQGERRGDGGGGNKFVPISQMRKVRPREVMGDL